MGSGGAPTQSFSTKKDIKALATHFEQATEISKFYDIAVTDNDAQRDRRNAFITGRMVLVDLRYIQFIRGLTRERQLLDSATDFFIMSLNLAGAGAAGTTTKTVLSSIAAGFGGTKAIIDRDFFYQKTVPALVAAMNAQRAVTRETLIKGLQQDIDAYPFHTAVVDVQNYYEAGTFVGALNAITADAAVKEEEKKRSIEEIIDLGPTYYNVLSALRLAVQSLKAADLQKAWSAFRPDVEQWAGADPQKRAFTEPKTVKDFQALYSKVIRSMSSDQKSALYYRFVEQTLIENQRSSQ